MAPPSLPPVAGPRGQRGSFSVCFSVPLLLLPPATALASSWRRHCLRLPHRPTSRALFPLHSRGGAWPAVRTSPLALPPKRSGRCPTVPPPRITSRTTSLSGLVAGRTVCDRGDRWRLSGGERRAAPPFPAPLLAPVDDTRCPAAPQPRTTPSSPHHSECTCSFASARAYGLQVGTSRRLAALFPPPLSPPSLPDGDDRLCASQIHNIDGGASAVHV